MGRLAIRLSGGLEKDQHWRQFQDSVNAILGSHENEWAVTVRPLTATDDERFTGTIEQDQDWRVRYRQGEIEILIPASFDLSEENPEVMPYVVCDMVWSIVYPDYGCEDWELED